MTITETKPVKKLRELLQGQQEPFILNIYLLERGYSRKSSNSESSSRCCHGNSSKSLKRSVSRGLNTSKRVNPQGSKVLRAVLNQVIKIKLRLRISSSGHRDGKLKVNEDRSNQQVAESDIFSTDSSTTVFNSFSESEVEEAPCATQKDSLFTTNTSQPVNLHNPTKKERTPVQQKRRILQKLELFYQKSLQKTAFYQLLLGKYFSPHQMRGQFVQKLQKYTNLFTLIFIQCLKSKMVLQQTKQLLFDYVKEIVETQGRERKQRCHHKQFLGSEELGSIIGEKTRPWDKQSGDKSNLAKLLNLDLLNSKQDLSNYKSERRDNGLEIGDTVFNLLNSEQDWNEYEQQREIGSEIGDTILEELVNDMVKNMIDFSSPITTC